jgi:hypothetical protein
MTIGMARGHRGRETGGKWDGWHDVGLRYFGGRRGRETVAEDQQRDLGQSHRGCTHSEPDSKLDVVRETPTLSRRHRVRADERGPRPDDQGKTHVRSSDWRV